MNLEEAADNAKSLGRPYTDQQKMDKALSSFEHVHGKDAHKAEDRWEEKPSDKRTWSEFMNHWKSEVHKIETRTKTTHRANQVVQEQVDELSAKFSRMETENRSLLAENHALNATHIQFQQALQTEQHRRDATDRNSSSDDVSALTEAVSRVNSIKQRLNERLAQMSQQISSISTQPPTGTRRDDSRPGPTTTELLHAAQNLPANTYAYMHGGKGLQYRKYCKHCGCNCTHWTRSCPYLNEDEKRRYKKASFRNTMGGSDRNMCRRDKYQADFHFDSF